MKWFVKILILLVFLSSVSCYTPIKNILSKPKHYKNRTVHIKGKIISSLSLEGFRAFTVKDNTGKIFVLTQSFLPVLGDKVKVRGKVKTNFTYQRNTLTVIVEKMKHSKDSMEYVNKLYEYIKSDKNKIKKY